MLFSEIHVNQSNPLPEYFGYIRSSHDPALLVSPLVVAGIVIGLVLFLSCVTIIIGSLRKDGRERDWRLENPSYDGISYAASSFGDLRSVCTGDISPALEYGSYLELSVSSPDYPPCYEDCVGPGALGMCLPADDPPPYSLEDPHLRPEVSLGTGTTETPLGSQTDPGHFQVSSPLSTVDLDMATTVQTLAKRSLHLPIIPMDIIKDVSFPGPGASEDNVT
ncbi:protein BEAN1 isoform 2-T6 [Anomaloglossus baeobatrachus]|uniref:protein BEAN1 isoform X2 n=1 Tax=Anomaloglossus baeobatrachus TaxID=238106 RepID=UPI003F4F47B3